MAVAVWGLDGRQIQGYKMGAVISRDIGITDICERFPVSFNITYKLCGDAVISSKKSLRLPWYALLCGIPTNVKCSASPLTLTKLNCLNRLSIITN